MAKTRYYNSSAIVFDDHQFFGEAFSMLLEHSNMFEKVQMATNTQLLMQFFMQKQSGPIYFFADYYIPDVNMLQVIADVRRFCPNVKVIILSGITNSILIKKILAQKPEGFLSKSAGIDELLACLDAISKQKTYISTNIIDILELNHHISTPFTAKELEVLAHIALGENIVQTAENMHLSRHTIIAHRKNMMAKTNCRSVTELLAHALSVGLLDNCQP